MSRAPIGPWAQVTSGNAWSIFDPRAEDFDVRDLRALRNICRFGGHVHSFYPYTVAEHSVRVTGIVAEMGATREVQWAALVHDAHEVYGLGDVIFPVKCDHPAIPASLVALPGLIRELERRTREAVRKALGAPLVMPPVVKQADLVMLATERRDLLGPCEHQWDPLPEPHREQVIAMPPNIAWREFVSLFEQLRPAGVPSIVDALAGAS